MVIEKINAAKITPTLQKGFVYCAFNRINNKVYIGYTQTTLNKRISSHYCKANEKNDSKSYFHNALIKYNKEDFEWFIFSESCELKKLKENETHFINLFNSNKRNFGYNLTTGGEQSYFNKEVCDKISKKAKERNLSGERNPFFGKTHSDLQKLNWSKNRKGIVNNPRFKNHTKKTKLKLSKIQKNLFKDPLHIEKISKSKKNSKPIECIETGVFYPSVGNASRKLKINKCSIKNQLHGRSKTAGGYTFKFI